MDEILKQLTIEYLEAVEDRCSLLFQALNVKNKFELDPIMRQCQEPRKEFFVNGKRYEAYLHGRGCNVFDGQINIDWDFDAVGYGINPHLLSYYIEQSAPELNKLYPEARIKDEFEKALTTGELVKRCFLYYYV